MDTGLSRGTVTSVSSSPTHSFSKPPRPEIRLLAGLGIEGDVHQGATVQHLSRMKTEPLPPNLRQVHLVHAELHDELARRGFKVGAGDIGENITTRGLDLLGLPTGTKLRLGETAVVEITGLRNPCSQLDRFQAGLTAAMLDKDESGKVIRKSGIMGIVLEGGIVRPGDEIQAELPEGPHVPLHVV